MLGKVQVITIRNKYMPLSKTEHEEEVEVEDVGETVS